MSVILNIDTALDIACISIAKEGVVINSVSNTEQKDHGGFLQPAIKALLNDATISTGDLDAVAIAAGPGSYTGLRVGMASAKGLCYALKKPLITIGTLEILTFGAIQQYNNTAISSSSLLCPMIDARRMEVFTALYDFSLKPVLEPCAMVLNENSFAKSLLKNQVLFFGTGSAKWELICRHKNALFIPYSSNPLAMSNLAHEKFRDNNFADLAYCEPLYLKEFFGAI